MDEPAKRVPGQGERAYPARAKGGPRSDGRLSRRAVERLHGRFRAELRRRAEEAMARAGTRERGLLTALMAYDRAAMRVRERPGPQALAELAARGRDEVARATAGLPDVAAELREMPRVSRALGQARRRDRRPRPYEALFGPHERIYIPFETEAGSEPGDGVAAGAGGKAGKGAEAGAGGETVAGDETVRTRVEAALRAAGYDEIDYAGGYAGDGRGNRARIGRVLRRQNPELLEAFSRDPARQGEGLMIALSRAPEDIAGMSARRGWDSCLAPDGIFYGRSMPAHLREATPVAYLVRKGDPEIRDPLARIHVKPFRNRRGEILLVAGDAYGIAPESFKPRLEAWLERAWNHDKAGHFELVEDVYADLDFEEVRRLKPLIAKPETLLRELDVPFSRRCDGGLKIDGDLDLSRLGLARLPRWLGRAEIAGSLNLAGNALVSLKNAPRRVGGHLKLGGNRLESLRGGPDRVGGDYQAHDNRLTSLAGAPRHVRGDFLASGNRLRTLDGAPRQVDREFNVMDNPLDSLQGRPESCGRFAAPRGLSPLMDSLTRRSDPARPAP